MGGGSGGGVGGVGGGAFGFVQLDEKCHST